MNALHTRIGYSRGLSEMFKVWGIVFLAIGVGILSNIYPPLFTVIGAMVFTILAIFLYRSTTYSRHKSAQAEIADTPQIKIKSGPLFYLCIFAFFLSITIPKSGKTISNVPITTANVFILLALVFWALKFMFSRKRTFLIPEFKPLMVLILYGGGGFLVGFVNKNHYKPIILDFVAFIGFIPVYFLVCSVVRSKTQLRKLILLITISSMIVCVYGALQPRLGFERIAVPGLTKQHNMAVYKGVGKWNIIEGGTQKVYSTFQNGNIFGNHLATFIPFLGGIFLGIRAFWKKILFLGIFLLSWYVLILTYSRGAFVGTLAGILTLAIISKKIRLKSLIVLFLIFVVLSGFLLYFADRPELRRYDFRRIKTNPDQFSAGRLRRAGEVLEGFYKLPFFSKLFGLGLGGTLHTPYWDYDYVDNLYLTLLYKMGIVGLVILLVILGHFLAKLFELRSRIDDLQTKALINGGIAGLVASLIHNLADTLWFFPPLSANFWFLAGITMTIGLIGAKETQESVSLAKS